MSFVEFLILSTYFTILFLLLVMVNDIEKRNTLLENFVTKEKTRVIDEDDRSEYESESEEKEETFTMTENPMFYRSEEETNTEVNTKED